MQKVPTQIKVKENILSEILEEEAVLLNLDTKTYFGLNETGTHIWTLLKEDKAPEKIIHSLTQKYEIAQGDAQNDFLKLINDLKKKRLIEIV